ncbi:1489_t:CDS:2 [Racocetra fulgida]|uniref:1489_t:CDS:1 n=1 Tax=Racocetra fulgida TaxID=60492 RepID=A0A9N8YZY4_9GLOM|nr:1489_t:CDS:2 [Racocetra fulgida]
MKHHSDFNIFQEHHADFNTFQEYYAVSERGNSNEAFIIKIRIDIMNSVVSLREVLVTQ